MNNHMRDAPGRMCLARRQDIEATMGGGNRLPRWIVAGLLATFAATFVTLASAQSPLGGIAKVVLGTRHGCALTTGGGVKCWGNNDSGQLGDGTTQVRARPVDVSGLGAGVAAIAAGDNHTCALTSLGAVKCWGENTVAQLGDDGYASQPAPVDPVGLGGGVVAISAGGSHSCALLSSGGVKCWGSNMDGELGDGMSSFPPLPFPRIPVDVFGLSQAIAVSAGVNHSCAVRNGGSVWCWGSNSSGQLGDGTGMSSNVPVASAATGAAAIAAGGSHTCALLTGGGLQCWGSNGDGRLGDGSGSNQPAPVDVSGLTSGVIAVVAGSSHTCATTTGGAMRCWGLNGSGQLGDGSSTSRATPAAVSGLASGVTALAAGQSNTCAVTGGVVKCWGDNQSGQLANGVPVLFPTAVDALGLATGVAAVSGGSQHACALTSGGGVKCWGANDNGQLGDGTTSARWNAVDVSGLASGVTSLALGNQHSCALLEDGTVRCWGSNGLGQAGDGTNTPRPTPVAVSGLTGVSAIAAGNTHTCAIIAGGAVRCWGANFSGELGTGATSSQESPPVAVSGLTNAIALAAGGSHSCVVINGGSVKCWGANWNGELGDGSTTMGLTPVTTTGIGDATALALGSSHSCALVGGGAMKCWGGNLYGQLGDGTPQTQQLSPVAVSGLSGATKIAAGANHTCAVIAAGALECWGENGSGQVGDGTTTQRRAPVSASGLGGVTAIGLGSLHGCAVTAGGGVKCWGANHFGQLGNGTAGYQSTPGNVLAATPDAPTAVTAAAGNAQAIVSFTAPTNDGGSPITGYKVTSIPAGGTDIHEGTTSTTHTVTGLSNSGQSYTFTVTASNANGESAPSAPSNSVVPMGSLSPPGAPVIGTASALANSPVAIVTWTAPASDGGSAITGYVITSNPTGIAAYAGAAATSAVVTDLSFGTTYTFTVAAVNGVGTGPASAASNSVVPALGSLSALPGASAVAGGGGHTCAVTAAGGIACWGGNWAGQLGDGSTSSRLFAVNTLGVSGATAVTAGYAHTCALLSGGAVKCWGQNAIGQLGDGTNTQRSTADDVAGLTSGVVAIAAGVNHSCAVMNNGSVRCWGANEFGQLGDGSTTQSLTPGNVTGLAGPVIGIAAGVSHTCALLSGGTVQCWGANPSGQLGDGGTTQSSTPVTVSGLSSVMAIAAGGSHTCAVLDGGGARCWGANNSGQLGDGSTTQRLAPVAVSGLSSATAIAAGAEHTCALAGGAVRCWGLNGSGQLGNGSSVATSLTPVAVAALPGTITAIGSGHAHTCAAAGSVVKCWGANFNGQVGNGVAAQFALPVDGIGLGSGMTAVEAGEAHSCAIAIGGAVKCWGANDNGQLGDGTTTLRPSAVDVVGLAGPATALAAGSSHTCALVTGGAVQCWGGNVHGQLGDGTLTRRLTATSVGGISGATAIAAGRSHTCALVGGGAINCWGSNFSGELGNGATATQQPTAVAVGGMSGAIALSAGGNHTCAVLTGGAVKCWGANSEGQLGDGTTTDSLLPATVSGLSNAAGLALGHSHSCAIDSAGGIRCWGYNFNGQLGDGTQQVRQLTPVAVSGLASGVTTTAAGGHHACAITGGVPKCWGSNASGQLGDGTLVERRTPVTVAGLAGVTSIAPGSAHTCALTGAGGIKCWGDNTFATLGIGTTGFNRIPVTVLAAAVPGAPTAVIATAGNQQASVSFTPPASDGGSPITGYTVTATPAEGTDTNAGTTATTHIVTGLVNGRAYTFTVSATNGTATGPASNPSNSVTPATVPDVPTFVVATPGNAQISVSFSAPSSDGGAPVTGYTATCGSTSATGAGSPVVVTGLVNGTNYTCTVVATNAMGDSFASSQSNIAQPAAVLPVLTIAKTPDDDAISANDTATFTILVTNTGPGPASSVTLFDLLPTGNGQNWTTSAPGCTLAGGQLYCALGDLASGAAVTIVASTPTSLGHCGTMASLATVSAYNAVPVSDTGVITCRTPVLAIAKTPDGGAIAAGQTATFTVVVTNNGPGTAYGVALGDPLPAGAGVAWTTGTAGCSVTGSPGAQTLGCTIGTMAPSATFTATVSAATDADHCAAMNSTATATAANGMTKQDAGSIQCAIPANLPGAPTIGTAVAGNAQIAVHFTAPGHNGGSAITGYTARCGGQSATGAASPITVSGLTNGTAYTCTASAANANGSGPSSTPSNAVTPRSNNANLAGLAISAGTLSPSFNAGTVSYSASVLFAVSTITVTPSVADATATVKVNGASVASGSPSNAIMLNVGSNTITVAVTAQDGATVKTYTIAVTRAPAINPDLSNLTLSAVALSPAFASGTQSYTASVPNSVSSVTVTPTLADSTATVKVNGATTLSGTPSSTIILAAGYNTITVVVTANDATTTKTYTIVVHRAPSTNASLSDLETSEGALDPEFAINTIEYVVAVAHSVTSVTVTPTAAHPGATITVNSVAVASGTESDPMDLSVDSNLIDVVVTAEDATTTKTYRLFVNRAPSEDPSLMSLTLSAGPLVPPFASGTLSYAISVGNGVLATSVTPMSTDIGATVRVNGDEVFRGSSSASIPLVAGPNTITIDVLAQDQLTTRTYAVVITRAPSSSADLASLALSAGTLAPAFNPATSSYTASVANEVDAITLVPITADSTATVKVNGTGVASGDPSQPVALAVGNNAITVLVTAQNQTTTRTYTVTVTRLPSSNAKLSALAVSAGTLAPAFSSTTSSYTVNVANSVTSITVTPVVADAGASVKVNNVTVVSGMPSAPIALDVGTTPITVQVTAQDGTTLQGYVIGVFRAPSDNANLASLVPSVGTLTPAFSSAITSYSMSVGGSVSAIQITPTAAGTGATITVDGAPVASGSPSGAIPLDVGLNSISVRIAAQDTTTIKIYGIDVTRELSYGVTYNGNGSTGGTAPVDNNAYDQGATVTVKANTGSLVRAGYDFIGWNTATDGSGTSYAASGSATFAIGAANVTLYAQWAVIKYSVTYNGNFNTSGAAPTDAAMYAPGETVTVKTNSGNLVRAGYTFNGWNTAANGSGASYDASGSASFPMGTANVTLFAQWTLITYGVSYDGNGSTGGSVPVDAATYAQAATVTVKANIGGLVRAGYTLAGWNTAADGSGTNYAATGSATFAMGSSNVTLYAKWTLITYSVTYDGNGSTGGTVPVDANAYAPGATVTVKANSGSLVRAGYNFSGWNTAANGSGTTYDASGSASFAIGSASVTLFAQWTIIKYTVTYDANNATGGTVPVDAGNYAPGEIVTVKANSGNLVRAGYTFNGWNTAANGSGTNYAASGSATFPMGSANVTLFAQWTLITYGVIYDGNGNTGGTVPVDAATYAPGATVTVKANSGNLARSGYNFGGWNTAADGSGSNYTAGSGTFAMGSSNVTLYAKWTLITYSVTYNGNGSTGGTVPVDAGAYAPGATVTVKAITGNLVKAGYTFAGWNTVADGSGTSYSATGSATFPMGSANVTLFAKWVSANASLNGLQLSSGSLSPGFASGTMAYSASVTSANNTITLRPYPADQASTVTVNGSTIPTGSASGPIILNAGSNTISTMVTAPDGVTTRTYVINVVYTPLASVTDAAKIAAGESHTCEITTGGRVKCWGANWDGQLGDGTTTTRTAAVSVSGITGAIAIAAGSSHTCAVISGGTVKCWGYNGYGQLGSGNFNSTLTPVAVTGIAGATEIAAGHQHSCARLADGTVKCWGLNYNGQLGNGSFSRAQYCYYTSSGYLYCGSYYYGSPVPSSVTGLNGVSAIAAAGEHTCAMRTDGTAACWGANYSGQLGDGTTSNRASPVTVTGLGQATAIAAGWNSACAIISGGALKCWGWNGYGQLGDGTFADRPMPVSVIGLSNVAAVAAGPYHTCALTGGSAKCWGAGWDGRLGDGSTSYRAVPGPVNAITGATGIALGYAHSCVVTASGSVKCWGGNWYGQLGNGNTLGNASPGSVLDPGSSGSNLAAGLHVKATGAGIASITAGGAHTCALTPAGGIKCWGRNVVGQLGDATTTSHSTATPVSGLASDAAGVRAGSEHTCAVTAAGGVRCWGQNANGQLGDGTTTQRLEPVDATAMTSGVGTVVTGTSHSCALTTSGGVKCWGNNDYGQLGDGGVTQRPVAGDVAGLTSGVVAIAAGADHTCALTSGGAVTCWGRNTYAQLGDGTTNVQVTPVSVPSLASGVAAISAGHDHTCAVTTSGSVRCWGSNSDGQLGDGTLIQRPIPVNVSGMSSGVSAIAAGDRHTCVLASGGVMSCWGHNDYGQVGDGTFDLRLTPAAVTGLGGGVTAIAAGASHSCAVAASGIAKCWGSRADGRLGDGSSTAIAEPADIATVAAPDRLVVAQVNDGAPVFAGSGFSVRVESSQANLAGPVLTDTAVSLSLTSGTGPLGGSTGCTIVAGAASCTVTGLTLSTAQAGAVITAHRTSGDNLADAASGAFSVNSVASTNASLSNLALSAGALSPAFAGSVHAYNVAVDNSIASIIVTPSAAHSEATIAVNGAPVASGAAAAPVGLDVGSNNVIATVVTAQDGQTKITYTVTVTRAGTAANLPGAPMAVAALSGNAQARVSFVAPTDGGLAIASYTATCTPTSGTPVSVTGPASPIVVAGLSNGVTYTCTVHATNSAGDGPESLPTNPVTPSALAAGMVTITLTGSGTGTVSSSPAGLACAGSCSHAFAAGTGVTLTAAPTGGSVFTGWLGGACRGSATTCSITVNAGVDIGATFAPQGTIVSLDVDLTPLPNRYTPLTDGLLLLRYLFGLTGNALISNAVGAGAGRNDPPSIKGYLDDIRPALDIDGNGRVEALIDGLLAIRYLFGLRGPALIANAVDPQGSRTTAVDIEAYIKSLLP